jgi:hypothetical protein
VSQISIKLSVSVSDGSYESSISVPVDSPKGKFEEFALVWLDMMKKCLEFSQKSPPETALGSEGE